VKPSVAFVYVTLARGRASGSGFVVSPDGLLVTALHVVEDAQEASLMLPGGRGFSADVVAASGDFDLAVLRIGRTDLPPPSPRRPHQCSPG
jgi:S1-C subfamily serine protease